MPRPARIAMYLMTAAIVLGFGKVHAGLIGHYDFSGSARFAWALAYIALLCTTSYGVGLPELPRSLLHSLVAGATAAVAAATGISLVQLVVGDALLPRFVVFSSAICALPAYTFCNKLSATGERRQAGRDRVVAVVERPEAASLQTELELHPERPALLAVSLTVNEARAARPSDQPLIDVVRRSDSSVVVLDRVAQADDSVVAQAARLHENGVRVRALSSFYDEWLGKLPLSELERVALMFDIGEVHRVRYGRLKRLVDVGLAVAALPVLFAMIPIILVGNAVANRGSLFYRQVRVGKGGRTFDIYKFRTMTQHTGPASWTTDDDPRVTAFGRLLRRCHLDELPQLVNILKGDLAIVGPRPEQPDYVAELSDKIPFYGLRHLVRPGLTGWAQVKYPYGADEIDALEKLQYEFYYLRHQGLALDARIIGRTLRSVAGRSGR